MFIRNNWYVAAWPHELTGLKPLGRTLLGEPVVLYRQADGKAVALQDRCCHRSMPLSDGAVVGNRIQCGYHGLEFDCTGRCVLIPGQADIPAAARVRSYPVVERDEVVWIWMGDEERADASKIVPYPWHNPGSGWAHRKQLYTIACNWELMNDNVMDLTHLAYVHRNTIGGNPSIHFNAEMKVTREGESIKAVRWLRDSTPPPTYTKAIPGLAATADRWQQIEYFHGLIRVYTGVMPVGRGGGEVPAEPGRDEHGLRTFDGITPETATSMHFFWSAAHSFDIDNPATTDLVYDQIDVTFLEDRDVLERQQARMSALPDAKWVDIRNDVAGLQVRRLVRERLALDGPAPSKMAA
ncbi:Rieske 2Fe-2S domain-containing protein [Ramlibacter sp.]|uniref:Rieske 2Fe-2S domain-containing protein n=1 Tax=Ramlibacter sp. TaxID=1917967 RepID=UPI003D149F5B